MSIVEWISATLILLGTLLMLLSAVGLLRMPDFYIRLSAASKATSLGAILLLTGFVLPQTELPLILRALATIVFVLITVPVASHAIARAGYWDGTKLWDRSVIDDLSDKPCTDHQDNDEN